jgi:hypothetical protein
MGGDARQAIPLLIKDHANGGGHIKLRDLVIFARISL